MGEFMRLYFDLFFQILKIYITTTTPVVDQVRVVDHLEKFIIKKILTIG